MKKWRHLKRGSIYEEKFRSIYNDENKACDGETLIVIAEEGRNITVKRYQGDALNIIPTNYQRASLQCAEPIDPQTKLVFYQGYDGVLWARPVDEFEDGRFEPVT